MSPIHASRSLWTSAAAAGYTGPGDIVSGALAWWGLRAYTNAGIGSNAVRLREDGGNTEQDFPTIAGGGLDLSAIATFKGGASLFVVKLYDQVGTNHLVQAAAGNQPKFTLSGIGALPVLQDNGSAANLASSAFAQAQPFTISIIYKITTTTDTFLVTSGFSPVQLRPGQSGANTLFLYAGTGFTTAVSDNVWHALQATYNTPSGDANVDGISNPGSTGGTGFNDILTYMGGAGLNLRGLTVEVGLWPSAFTGAQSTNMSANQHAYWGF